MQLKYKFSADGLMTDIWFDGLDESEPVTSVSQDMTKLRVKNPAVVFTEEAKAGVFDEISDEEYYSLLSSIECIAMLWRYTGDKPADKSTRMEVNVLTLLANAINLLTQQNIQLKKLTDILDDEPDLPDFDEPDFAPDPTDEKTLAEIEEAEGRKAALDVLEREWERVLTFGDEIELDDFGNPIVEDIDDEPTWDDLPEDLEDPFEECPDAAGEKPSGANSDNKPNNG